MYYLYYYYYYYYWFTAEWLMTVRCIAHMVCDGENMDSWRTTTTNCSSLTKTLIITWCIIIFSSVRVYRQWVVAGWISKTGFRLGGTTCVWAGEMVHAGQIWSKMIPKTRLSISFDWVERDTEVKVWLIWIFSWSCSHLVCIWWHEVEVTQLGWFLWA